MNNDWELAKTELDSMDFLDDMNFYDAKRHEEHTHKKAVHNLITYQNKEPISVGGFDCVAKYNFCKECNQVRNKVLTIFNPDESICYQKVFKLHGKDPKEGNLMQDVATIFNSLILFAI